MDTQGFRVHGKAMVEYMCEYMESLSSRRVTPSVEPGYLRKLLPKEAPDEPEPWERIMEDVNSQIMPGVSFEGAVGNNVGVRPLVRHIEIYACRETPNLNSKQNACLL
ncbi:hypothetical protein J6590_057327 [Homalodisca vitripennis]|nr:hypothetical protein J6590_057327 [Homalodisca vitripennis]